MRYYGGLIVIAGLGLFYSLTPRAALYPVPKYAVAVNAILLLWVGLLMLWTNDFAAGEPVEEGKLKDGKRYIVLCQQKSSRMTWDGTQMETVALVREVNSEKVVAIRVDGNVNLPEIFEKGSDVRPRERYHTYRSVSSL